jgi:hypothetical protein
VGVKRIAQYLRCMRDVGMFLRPQENLHIDCYVDADFAGVFLVADKQDPISFKSQTGYVIIYQGAPLFWASKM